MKILITGGSGFIGTNFLSYIKKNYPKYSMINIDNHTPRKLSQQSLWIKSDIKDYLGFSREVQRFDPNIIVHFAAKASLLGDKIEDFPDNLIGTKNVIDCVKSLKNLKKFIHISTQYVNTPGQKIDDETRFDPYTAYGASKAEGEKIVREANILCDWIILRPTNIWGPWHSFFPHELWLYLSKNYYVHPGFKPIKKHYGFIGNTLRQIDFFIHSDDKDKKQKVFYLTDPPIDSYQWMNGFSKALSGKKVRRIPKVLWKTLALTGDFLKYGNIKFPVDSGRFFRLTVNEDIPYKDTIDLVGGPTFSLEQGIEISVNWIKKYHSHIINHDS